MKSSVATVVALLVAVLLYLGVQPASGQVRVAAFNIRNLGMTRIQQMAITRVIVRILCQYDLTFVQEVRTHQMGNLPVISLGTELNNFARNSPHGQCRSARYAVDHRGPLGTTNHQEYYVLIYNPQVVRLSNIYIYPQQAPTFERPPIVALMRLLSTRSNFILIGVHTQPRNVLYELNALSDVFQHAIGQYHIRTGFIMGDFNAGTKYLNGNQLTAVQANMRTQLDLPCQWLIQAMTNVAQTQPYDRIVAIGQRAIECYVPNSARVNIFNDLVPNGLTPGQISDHYPVEMALQCPVARWWHRFTSRGRQLRNHKWNRNSSHLHKGLPRNTRKQPRPWQWG